MRWIDGDRLAESLAAGTRGRLYSAEEKRALAAIAAWVARRMDELPEAAPETARHGTWTDEGDLFYRCSECSKLIRICGTARYCANCGARMDMEETARREGDHAAGGC